MTNAEKYLKDGVNIQELWKNFDDYYFKNKEKESDVAKAFKLFFGEQVKPTLTEDERVILRNIKNFTTIIRNIEGNIQVENKDGSFACLCAFNHLFQFIKLGEKYEIKELLDEKVNNDI